MTRTEPFSWSFDFVYAFAWWLVDWRKGILSSGCENMLKGTFEDIFLNFRGHEYNLIEIKKNLVRR